MIEVRAECDATDCTMCATFAFEFAIETYAHLIEALGELGWFAVVSEPFAGVNAIQRRTRTYCPMHRATAQGASHTIPPHKDSREESPP